jgi:hypothetical protein
MEVINNVYDSIEIGLRWLYKLNDTFIESIAELDKVSVSLLSFFNPIKPSGYYTYHLLLYTEILHSVHSHLCVSYGSHNKRH